MKKVFSAAVLLSLLPWNPLSTLEVQASDSVCVDRTKFIKRLKNKYAERQISNGINYNGVIVEIFASEDGHFTILATYPSGVSCLVASGDNWQDVPLLKAEIGL